jgi:hypothetical protein
MTTHSQWGTEGTALSDKESAGTLPSSRFHEHGPGHVGRASRS